MAISRPNRKYSTTLSAAISDTITTTFNINAVPNNVPCILLVDPGTASEEKVKCTAKGVSTITVTRGYGGTTATTHNLGASVVDYNAPEYIDELADVVDAHFDSAGAVIGGSALATKTGTETLTNKTITDTASNVMAKSLKSATTTVDVAAATAPTAGQVLTATSSTTATWQTATASGVIAKGTVGASSPSTSGATVLDLATVSLTAGDLSTGATLVVSGFCHLTGTIVDDQALLKYKIAGATQAVAAAFQVTVAGKSNTISFTHPATVTAGAKDIVLTLERQTGTGSFTAYGDDYGLTVLVIK